MNKNYFKDCTTLQEVKKKFKELALLHHPDRGGDTATMQAINAEYESIIKNKFYDFASASAEDKEEFIKYPEIINKIISLPGIIIEVIGNWIWLSGSTFIHRAYLKETGFFFAPAKKMWYYRPAEWVSSNIKPLPIEEIRLKYGSDRVEGINLKQIKVNC